MIEDRREVQQLVLNQFISELTHEEEDRSYLCGTPSRITFVLIDLRAKSVNERRPFLDLFLLMSLVPPQNMIKSFFIKVSRCDMVILTSM